MEKRRLGKTGHMSSILIFGACALSNATQKEADAAMELAMAHGINHIDVSPLYGKAEKCLGSWFKRHGQGDFFLGCKTAERRKAGAWEGIKRSLDALKVDKFDLFQFHGVDEPAVLDTALGPGGAMEAILEAKEQGLLDYIGITGHRPPLYAKALARFDFATVLFPLNRIHAAHLGDWNDYRPLLELARKKDVGVMAIKTVAKGLWADGREEMHAHRYNTWYEPFDDASNIEKSLYFTLSQAVTGCPLPSELSLWPMMIEMAERFKPLSAEQQREFTKQAEGYEPLRGPVMD
jgi:aryl-alcohol dehydrogenase-like predicted oxidoreductase